LEPALQGNTTEAADLSQASSGEVDKKQTGEHKDLKRARMLLVGVGEVTGEDGQHGLKQVDVCE